ncbi:MAG: c-type cytochrome [Alphaproteobacteria bacterium]|nr:c-type cytochrome [Alphaproteobacteria bacterium]MDE2011474.1 c-type cytochrome [Alphaproteobacteria bacterium]MDE2071865.1 c-type cytochrome [Alphaproteobacteria bacterium]MDE2351594.1 c-type cytochrome [Alphaproteobacteria bacterium]
MKSIAILAAAGAVLFAVSASAQPSVPMEPALVASTCSQCHGDRGLSIAPLFPDLAAQNKDYLVTQLKAFRDHKRSDAHAQAYMWGMAGDLTDDTIDAIATYFAALPPPPRTSGLSPEEVAAGKAIFENGVAADNVPACNACHGDTAAGSATIPRLAGQHREYLAAQLLAFRTKQRYNEIMSANVAQMTDEQIRDVSSYLASLASPSSAEEATKPASK